MTIAHHLELDRLLRPFAADTAWVQDFSPLPRRRRGPSRSRRAPRREGGVGSPQPFMRPSASSRRGCRTVRRHFHRPRRRRRWHHHESGAELLSTSRLRMGLVTNSGTFARPRSFRYRASSGDGTGLHTPGAVRTRRLIRWLPAVPTTMSSIFDCAAASRGPLSMRSRRRSI